MIWVDEQDSMASGNLDTISVRPSFDLNFKDSGSVAAQVGPTITRGTTATFDDFENKVRTAISGEMRFAGLRRVQNLLGSIVNCKSEDLTTANWNAGTGVTKAVDSFTYDGSSAAGGQRLFTSTIVSSPAVGRSFRVSFEACWVTPPAGTNIIRFRGGNFTSLQTATLTSEWQRFSTNAVETADGSAGALVSFWSVGGNNDSFTMGLRKVQLEEVTGQSNTNPSEYVSVGDRPAPYHGAGVDGVKYLPNENPNVVENTVVYDRGPYLSVPGSAGEYASTPDTAANSITSDIDIRVFLAMTDWTPASQQTLLAKWNTGNRAYMLRMGTTGRPIFSWSPDGTAISRTATTGTGFTDGTAHWVRATWDANDGAGNDIVVFYTSEDGVTWTQLGASVITASGGGTIVDANTPVELGASNGGTIEPLAGRIYKAQVFNGINGTLVLEFNAGQASVSGTGVTVRGTTGETWTVAGSVARITGAMISGTIRKGLLTENTAATNVCLQSQDLATTWTPTRATVTANAVTAPDGTLTADKLVEDATAANTHTIAQAITFTNAVHTYSHWALQGERTEVRLVLFDGTTTFGAYFNLATGAVGATSNCSGFIKSYPNGWYRCVIVTSSATAAAAGTAQAQLASAGNNTYNGDGVSGAYLWGAQVEARSCPSSYIATTTASATRNGDVLTYPTAGWLRASEGTFLMEGTASDWTFTSGNSNGICQIETDSNNRIIWYFTNTSGFAQVFAITGGVSDVAFGTRVGTLSTAYKFAGAYKLNDFATSFNGQAVETDTTSTVPPVTMLRFGTGGAQQGFPGTISRVRYYNTRLPNTTLVSLST